MGSSTERETLRARIQHTSTTDFEAVALAVFRYQAAYNSVYADWLRLLRVSPDRVRRLADIPCLPIACFKSHDLRTGSWSAVRTFSSSGTTGSTTSHHPLRDETWYRDNAHRAFARVYGPVADYAVLALLPAYLERDGSSLVFMAADFIQRSRYPESGFFLHDTERLLATLQQLEQRAVPTLLLGVSFALLDLAEQHPQPLRHTLIMETGGMKGRRRELTRPELHQQLATAFGQSAIHSEYGMTELLSQAYATADGLFRPAPTLRILGRRITDPLQAAPLGKTAGLNLIDLANLDTVSFIASDDLGQVYADGSFTVLGRLDHSDVRGCNLLVGEVG